MMFQGVFFAAIFCTAYAVSPQLVETFEYETTAPVSASNYIDIALILYQETGTISQVQIVDAGNDAACTFDYSSLTGTIGKNLNLRINTNTVQFTDQASSPPGVSACDVSGTKATGDFTFYIVFRTVSNTVNVADKIFTINPLGADVTGRTNAGALENPPPPPSTFPTVIPVTKATYTFSMVVEDQSGTVVTNLNLGASFKLRFTMTVDPYSGLEYACATLTNCITDVDNSFTNKPRTMIDTNGCGSGTFLTRTQAATYGFSKDGSTTSSSLLTYIAKTGLTEVMGYFQGNLAPATNNELHFRCELNPSYDGSGSAVGTCGGNHCNPSGRKKRENGEDVTTVTASVSITPDKQQDEDEEDCNCEDPLVIYGSAGGLGVVAATCFIVMVLTFINVHLSTTSGSKSSRSRGSSSNSTPMSFIGVNKGYSP